MKKTDNSTLPIPQEIIAAKYKLDAIPQEHKTKEQIELAEMFEEKYGDEAAAQIADRTHHALTGIPKTLAAIKRIAESGI
jgi:hypothetical protein